MSKPKNLFGEGMFDSVFGNIFGDTFSDSIFQSTGRAGMPATGGAAGGVDSSGPQPAKDGESGPGFTTTAYHVLYETPYDQLIKRVVALEQQVQHLTQLIQGDHNGST